MKTENFKAIIGDSELVTLILHKSKGTEKEPTRYFYDFFGKSCTFIYGFRGIGIWMGTEYEFLDKEEAHRILETMGFLYIPSWVSGAKHDQYVRLDSIKEVSFGHSIPVLSQNINLYQKKSYDHDRFSDYYVYFSHSDRFALKIVLYIFSTKQFKNFIKYLKLQGRFDILIDFENGKYPKSDYEKMKEIVDGSC